LGDPLRGTDDPFGCRSQLVHHASKAATPCSPFLHELEMGMSGLSYVRAPSRKAGP
jgi:hypothetical protein